MCPQCGSCTSARPGSGRSRALGGTHSFLPSPPTPPPRVTGEGAGCSFSLLLPKTQDLGHRDSGPQSGAQPNRDPSGPIPSPGLGPALSLSQNFLANVSPGPLHRRGAEGGAPRTAQAAGLGTWGRQEDFSKREMRCRRSWERGVAISVSSVIMLVKTKSGLGSSC